MRKTVNIDQVYTFSGIRLDQNPYIEFAKEFLEDENLDLYESGYYKFLLFELKKYESVWGYIRTPYDVLERTKKFKAICLSIKNDGYTEIFRIHFNHLKKAYGNLTMEEREGKLHLVDGLHRASILIALGRKELTINQFVWSYQDMYPPAKKLAAVKFDWAGKHFLEVGCNIGAFGNMVLQRGALSYRGFDHKEEYIQEGRGRFPHLDLKVVKGQNIEWKAKNLDVFVALGVFHHCTKETIEAMIENIDSKYLLFENPIGNEPMKGYPYKIRPREFYWDIIKPKSFKEFPWGFKYPIERKIFICER